MSGLIFPQPQRCAWLPGQAILAGPGPVACHLVLHENAAPLERAAAELLAEAITAMGGGWTRSASPADTGISIYIGASAAAQPGLAEALAQAPDNPEAYALLVGRESIALLGTSPAGTWHAAQTLKQLLHRQGEQVVAEGACIVDWPDFRYRGLYMESKWGPDLMTLQDWQVLIDYMAGLKLNSLGIGIYGCWVIQYEGRRTEFLMLPFPEHPELETSKTIRYYSAQEQAWKALTYRPTMFTEDTFGQIVAYAKSRNITVRPHFNGPGHNTLIPYTHPDVSALDESGQPTGYGYCLSNPHTYALLFELWDSLIKRYLLPNAVDWCHIGLDEIWITRGIDEQAPERLVDPWCKCPVCRARSQQELLVDYLLKVTQHLAAQGMNHICVWYDQLNRSGLLTPDLTRRLEEAGVKEKVVLQWWNYNEPTLEIRKDLGLRAWITPMAGYYYWLLTQSYTSNIYPHLHLAYRAGAEGADAYCTFDRAYDRNYHCLAEYAWNQTTVGDLYQFKSRYAHKVMGCSGFEAVEAFEKWDQVYDCMALVPSALDMLLVYWHTYSRARAEYPRNMLRALSKDSLRLMGLYRGARTNLERARQFFAARRDQAPDASLIDEYIFECRRLIAVVNAYEAMLAATKLARPALTAAQDGQVLDLQTVAAKLRQALGGMDGMMALGEQVKATYLLPQLLRDLSYLRGYLAEMTEATEAAVDQEEARLRLSKMLSEID